MLKRKKTVTEEEMAAPATKVVAVVGSAGRYFNIAALVTLTILLLAAAVILFFQVQQSQQANQKQLQVIAKSLAEGISDRLASQRDLLIGLAAKQELINPLISEDIAALHDQEQQLQRLLTDALKVRLLPKGWDQLEADSNPPFSY
ncbi:MAG: hypothetical protein OQL17_09285, partial [Sedimenticola sp.]|nr:hypothetical protein [Sedimenticola sp.]